METFSPFVYMVAIVLLGFLAQWFSWKIRTPSIVFLFATGLFIGPVTGLMNPDALFGNLIFPIVSALIGIILFEGGLTLNLDDLGGLKTTVFKVIFVGGVITFLLTSLSAYYLFSFGLQLSFLLGGILVVTGPTVVIPLLHQIRPDGDVGSIARWEGIIIDPLGAILAVIIFEIVLSGVNGTASGFGFGVLLFGESIVVGGVIGVLAGYILVTCFHKYWIPDYLHNFAIIAGVLTAQALSNQILHESGLLAVTVMGMYMANQEKVTIRHIVSFKEDLRVLFISVLFIILVARLDRSFLFDIQPSELIFLGVLILLVRPLAIAVSTVGSDLSWPERGFLAWIAPRGIVAAAVASLFSYKLEILGISEAAHLADITFFVIAGTVLIYGMTLSPLARLLGLSEQNPQGVLFVGASQWVRELAAQLKQENILVRLIDKSHEHVVQARAEGLEAMAMDVTTESEIQSLDIQGIGYFVTVTPNDEVNTIACLHAMDLGFDSSEIFQLPPHEGFSSGDQPDPLKGRLLFRPETHYEDIRDRYEGGWTVDVISMRDDETVETIQSELFKGIFPLLTITPDQDVEILSDEIDFFLEKNQRLACLKSPDVEFDHSA